MSRWLRCSALAAAVGLLAACGADSTDNRATSPSTVAEPTTSASPSPSPTVETGQGGEDEAAAGVAALASYNGGWALLVQSRRDPGAKPNWELDYRQFYTDPILSSLLGRTYGMRDAGLASPTGEPIRDPQTSLVDLDRQEVQIRDCVDYRAWPEIFVATGELNSIAEPPFVLEARVVYDEAAGRWLVAEQTPQPDQPC